MSAKSIVKTGFLAMIAATSLVGTLAACAADSQFQPSERKVTRVDVIDTLDETVAQLDSQRQPTEEKVTRVDVIDTIEAAKGRVYAYSKSGQRVDVIENIESGSEGPMYTYSNPTSH